MAKLVTVKLLAHLGEGSDTIMVTGAFWAWRRMLFCWSKQHVERVLGYKPGGKPQGSLPRPPLLHLLFGGNSIFLDFMHNFHHEHRFPHWKVKKKKKWKMSDQRRKVVEVVHYRWNILGQKSGWSVGQRPPPVLQDLRGVCGQRWGRPRCLPKPEGKSLGSFSFTSECVLFTHQGRAEGPWLLKISMSWCVGAVIKTLSVIQSTSCPGGTCVLQGAESERSFNRKPNSQMLGAVTFRDKYLCLSTHTDLQLCSFT